jgi:hypothetical protein
LADFTVLDAHGYWGASGRLDINWVESHPVNTTFLWSNGCAIGNLDYPDNFLTSALYSPTSAVLVAKGTTNDSGGMGNNQNGFFGHNIATAMSAGTSLGQSIVNHVNVPLVYPWSESREFHFASAVVLGDPTLSLSSSQSVPLSIKLDIKPGELPNSINPKSNGVIPVAILTTDTFDATTINPLSVRLGPNGATEAHGKGHVEDVDRDRDLDLVLHFNTQEAGIICGDTSASLTGQTFSGQRINGSDSIRTVGCK